jgi:hypothetical protein
LEDIISIANSYPESDLGAHLQAWDMLSPMEAIAFEDLSCTFEKYLKDGLTKIWPDPEVSQYRGWRASYAPLDLAAEHGHVQLVRVFLAQRSHASLWVGSGDGLISAAQRGYTAIVQVVLDFWAEHSQDKVLADEKIVESRSSTLARTAANGSLEMVQLLLSTDINIGALWSCCQLCCFWRARKSYTAAA